ncbi:MAG: GTP-binding protein [Candidatus Micrarchaeota archaeon]|nr:GTP-binding protein [Candidatus Micrarchaeota archaeon]
MKVINITLLGHKDHGKSTLIGNLLIHTKSVTETRINEAKKTSSELGRQFEPGYILDSFEEERMGEMTIDTTRAEIVHKDLAFAFIDVPGHEELIKNMISGASYAEIALLLVSAKADEGIRDQTKRHIFIARMLGIKKLIVAVNKMDMVGYDQERFEQIKEELNGFIHRIGFGGNEVYFVPTSAYKAENLLRRSTNMKWYRGKSLIDLLYVNAKIEDKKKQNAPLRITVQGAIEAERETIVGKVVSGKVSVGDEISVLPFGKHAKVTAITVKGKRAKTALVNDDVAMTFDRRIGGNVRGAVIANKNEKPRLTNTIEGLIFVTGPIKKNLSIKINSNDVRCKSLSVLKYLDTTTGMESGEDKVRELEAIRAKLVLGGKMPVEDFDSIKELGRFVLYSDRKFAGIGIIG